MQNAYSKCRMQSDLCILHFLLPGRGESLALLREKAYNKMSANMQSTKLPLEVYMKLDELGRKLQDLELPTRRRAPKKKGD